jgi:predicted RNase H-like HicB family nuclease
VRQEIYTVRVHHEELGDLWAEVLELPGCFASGATLNELQEAVAEAIGLYLSDDDHQVRVEQSTWPAAPQQAEYRDKVVLTDA